MTEDRPEPAEGLPQSRPNGLPIVAIGTSAGGLEACRSLLANIPATSGFAFILVQHLDPTHDSMLVDLLGHTSAIPVVQAADGMRVEADRLYVIPAGGRIWLSGGFLRVAEAIGARGTRLPFDYLLQSLAADAGSRAIAVVLSGNGADGCEGLRAIHTAGGLILAQDPKDASHSDMPAAAIETGLVDAVHTAAEIGPAIMARARGDFASPGRLLPDWLAPILSLLKAQGHNFNGYKPGTMQRRIERRALMAGHSGATMQAYVERLEGDHEEVGRLASDLLINVTSFFRDPEVFAHLVDHVVPDLVRGHEGEGPIRLWCAACSTGEETWSLAMIVLAEIEEQRPDLKLQIFATDLDADAIATARLGLYPASISDDVSADQLQRYFIQDDHGWRVGLQMRRAVVFAVHNLLVDPPFSKLDMVSCRNFLIYLQPEAQARAISLFHFALRPGGLLLLGRAEAVPDPAGRFFLMSKHAHLYRRGTGKRQAGLTENIVTAAPTAPQWPLRNKATNRLQAVEAELASTRAELASALLHLERAGAEQLAINADTMSSSEEYQTANEELLTSQEELQSLNEELVALNGQLQETLERQRTTADDLQNILYSTDIATIFLDSSLNIRFFTPATRALFRMLPGDLGRPLTDLAPITPDEMLESDARSVLADQVAIERETESAAGNWYCRRIQPYRAHDNQAEGVVITYTDITERRQTRQILQEARETADAANLAKSRFLAAASHDLRQPLQALVLLQALLVSKSPGAEVLALLARVDKTLGSMSGMLNSLLDANQVEAGALNVEILAFPIDSMLSEVVQAFSLQAAEQGLLVRYVASSCAVSSDQRLLRQMIDNLVANALKYTKKGRIVLGARRRGRKVDIEVWDTGIGIPESEIKNIFRPYHQLETDKGGAQEIRRGLGLGLSIVSSLGELLGHDISVRSKPGRGSVFRITMPRADEDVARRLPQQADPIEPKLNDAGPCCDILVIDDEVEILDLVGQLLTMAGHRVVLAADEAEAMAALAGKMPKPQLIIADYGLTGARNGIDLVTSLRQEIGQTVPVIMLTGDISVEALSRFAAQDFWRISKPVRAAELLAAIKHMIETAEDVDSDDTGELVHIIDDDPEILHSLGELLANAGLRARMSLSSEAFRATWQRRRTGCLLVDAELPGESGIALMQSLKENGGLPPTIVITGKGDMATVIAAMRAGALDFVEKPLEGDIIIAGVRRALASHRGEVADDADRTAALARLSGLTARQTEVMNLVLVGHPSKNIAVDLKLSQRTVENHRAEIMRRTKCRSTPELVRLVMTAGAG